MSRHERERLSGYLDGELDSAARAEVEAHLAACPECTAFLADLATVDEAAAALPAEAPAGYFESFPARVRARLEEARPSRLRPRASAAEVRRSPIRRLPAWTWAAAAALLLAVITPLMLRQGRPAAPAYEAPPAGVENAPAAVPMPPPQALGDGAGTPEPKSTPAPPVASRLRPSATAAPPQRSDRPLGVQPPATEAGPEQKRNEAAEARFAPRPTAPAPADLGLERQQAARDAESEGAAGGVPAGVVDGVVAQDAARPAKAARVTPQSAIAAEAASPTASTGNAGHEAQPASLEAQDDAFRRLDAARPRTAAGWRRVREQWKALAAAEMDPVRADDERVRAIIAAREAWQAEGEASDEAAFRAEAESYLRRDDARQRPRVEGLLAEARGRTP